MTIDLDSIYSFYQLGKRGNQEDARYPNADHPDTSNAVFVVCDGVGGSEKGEVASATVANSIGNSLASHTNQDPMTDNDLQCVLAQAYDALDDASDSSNQGMGTTLTFLALHTNGALAAHIGDSRIYQIRPNEGIVYRSEDHSLVNSLLRSGNISPDEAKNHPRRNVITRCMNANDGSRQRDDATICNLQDIAPGDYFLLCSDGVVSQVDDEELIVLYSSAMTDQEKYDWLRTKCIDSSDNNTAIQIHVGLVTIDPIMETPDTEDVSDANALSIKTTKLNRLDDSVHELSPSTPTTTSKFKTFLNKIFK